MIPEDKILTKRGHVMINDKDAEGLNGIMESTKRFYELAEEEAGSDDEKEKRKQLFAKAKELGLAPAKNITTEKLEELINQK